MIRFLVAVFLFGLGSGLAAQESKTPESGPQEEREVELRRDVTGVVRGAPKGATVRVTVWRCDFQRYRTIAIGETLTRADGNFGMPGVPWIPRYRRLNTGVLVIARCPGKSGLTRLLPGADLSKVRVDLTDSIDLRGRVTDEDTGLPIAGVRVWPASFSDPDRRLWTTAPILPWVAHTGADGRFVVRGLPRTDTLEFLASGPQHAQSRVFVEDPSKPADCTLERGGRICGVVRMPNGEPAVRVRVAAVAGGQSTVAVTDERGRFCTHGLVPDEYLLFSDIDGYAVIALTGVLVEAGKGTADQLVEFVRGGQVRGRLVDAEGNTVRPTRYCDVAVNGPARPTRRWCQGFEVMPDGTFRCLLPPGKNRLRLRGGNVEGETEVEIDVVDGAAKDVTFEVRLRKQ